MTRAQAVRFFAKAAFFWTVVRGVTLLSTMVVVMVAVWSEAWSVAVFWGILGGTCTGKAHWLRRDAESRWNELTGGTCGRCDSNTLEIVKEDDDVFTRCVACGHEFYTYDQSLQHSKMTGNVAVAGVLNTDLGEVVPRRADVGASHRREGS